ncbi:TatD family hydrolase [Algoriphagus namhaensis]|uniref:TatD family hydrolase n=1 Tax=Algoriphagus namhaensis TaxID=915353 RepID=A0ABV8ATV7_9BACT
MTYIDTHAHIYSRKFQHDIEDVMKRIEESGVSRVYMPNIDVESIESMLDMERDYPGICIPMMGLHPCDVKEDFKEQLKIMEAWFEKRAFAAVGEIGLDLYWDKTRLAEQTEALRIQINWAKRLQLPIVLHCRESMDETIEVVLDELDSGLSGIFHCFTGNLEQAKRIIDMGFYLGIGGVATFKNGGLDQVLPHLSLDHIVLETDAPYLAPVPHRGKRNSPEYLDIIAEKVGDFFGVSKEIVAKKTTENALKVFAAYESQL